MTNPITDIAELMAQYQFLPSELTAERLNFRISLLAEELTETNLALEKQDAEELVDGLVDIAVIALGTLQLAGVDVTQAWETVHRANMSKIRGVKPGRVSDGWDLMKPVDWVAPDHSNNTGNLPKLFMEKTK